MQLISKQDSSCIRQHAITTTYMAPVATGIKKENVIANKRKWAKMNSH